MVDLTSSAFQFEQTLAVGDFFAALGLPHKARKLDVDVAAARMADRFPWLARSVTTIAQVLTHPDRRSAYLSLHALRNSITEHLVSQHGQEILAAIPGYNAEVWKYCCELVHFDWNQSELTVGPKGVQSLAEQGVPWIIEQLLGKHLPVVSVNPPRPLTVATREIWLADCEHCGFWLVVPCQRKNAAPAPQLEPCPLCGQASTYDDTYTFALPPDCYQGAVIRGQGQRTGKTTFALLNGPPIYSFPAMELQSFYQFQADGEDLTLEELRLKHYPLPALETAAAYVPWTKKPPPNPVAADTASWGCLTMIITLVLGVLLRAGCGVHQSRPASTPWEPSQYQAPGIEIFRNPVNPNNKKEFKIADEILRQPWKDLKWDPIKKQLIINDNMTEIIKKPNKAPLVEIIGPPP